MPIIVAVLAVTLIWSTTPLAIQWSSEGSGFLFGVAARMTLGALFCLALMGLLSVPLPRHRRALLTYLTAGLGIFGAMFCVYWAAQYIPSGLIAVLYGLSPMITGICAALWLQERAFSVARLLGMLFGLGGLWVIFGAGWHDGPVAAAGMLGVLVSVFVHAISSVWVKRIDAQIPAMAVAGGGLLVAALLYLLVWLGLDGHVPQALSARAGYAILYLSLVGSVVGFVLFYYILKRVAASRIALITFVTPVLALTIGMTLNGEVINDRIWSGIALILFGLMVHQWGDRLWLRPARLAPDRRLQIEAEE